MMRRIVCHSNVVWPRGWAIALFVLAYGIVDGGIWLLGQLIPHTQGKMFDVPEIVKTRTLILVIAAGFHAVYRLVRFHPACNPFYVGWLRLTPWTADKPLPFGPVHPVWQDVAVIAVLTAIATFYIRVNPLLPLYSFGLAYLIGLTLLLAFTRMWMHCLILGFLWPSLWLPGVEGTPLMATLIAAIIAVLWSGYRKSLHAFPWHYSPTQPRSVAPGNGKSILQLEIKFDLSGGPATSAGTISTVGWPYISLSPKHRSHSISGSTGFLISSLLGWWSYCILICAQADLKPAVIVLLAAVAAMFRFGIYCSGIVPALNLWGRIRTGRIVMPGFDQVFLTPLAVVGLAILGGIIISRSGDWRAEATACVIAAIWFVLFSGKPTLQKWFLTGHHRYRQPPTFQSNKQLIRPL